jgi:hypothetical protein
VRGEEYPTVFGQSWFDSSRRRVVGNHIWKLGVLLDMARDQRGYDTSKGGFCFIVSPDGAAMFLRDLFGAHSPIDHVRIDSDPDCLFLYQGIPVRVRVDSPPGRCFVVLNENVVKPRCCDYTSMAVLLTGMREGVS